MSRTPGSDDPQSGGSDASRRSRRPGANQPPNTPGESPADLNAGRLNEPRATDRYVRGRTRLTVRELMEQMNAGEPPASAASSPSASPSAQGRAPEPDDSPTELHRFGNENDVTTRIPLIRSAPGDVDLSDDATTQRVMEESRGQGGPRPPMQRTPDLSDTVPPRSRPLRHPPTAEQRRRHMARNATVTGRILVAIACVLALVGTGFVWGYLKSVNGTWNTINAVNPDDENIRNKNAQTGDETYLIVGTDTRGGKNSKVGAGTTADAEGARSDTVILVNIPANRSRVVAVSFPRDLQVDRPQCQDWDNDNGTYGQSLPAADAVKLNSIYADGGPKCLVQTLTRMSGLNINHFIAMDFFGFEKVVTAIGGVQVCSTKPLYDYELGQVLRKAGKQKLTGRRALNYVRARNISSEGNGDYGRIKRQQLFMSSLLRSTLSGNVLANPNKLNSLVNTFIQYSYVDGVDTNSLLNLADSMQGIDAGRVTFLTIPTSGTATDGSNNELPRTDDIDAIFNAIIDDDPLPGEKKATKSPSSSSKPSSTSKSPSTGSGQTPGKMSATAQYPGNVGVRVLNGTGRSGLATEVSDQLSPLGFDVRGVADASSSQDTTVIRYGTGEQDSAATLATMFPGAKIQQDRNVKSGVEVILGNSYDGSLGSVPSAGETLSVQQLAPSTDSSALPNDLSVTNAGDTTCS
ncbi:LCP family protein [Gordonia soli]|uniref:Putative LytR family regulatory protein n=1 Tax=Gordonia soli NBRC 108243 TaxID=1223545 RepID=M0QIG7_9ACTN|nr:LCP family protein [Gordonia soli]GAC68390.1 putative LytR family regulatory protein [Gordonia soli NBRC 108243]